LPGPGLTLEGSGLCPGVGPENAVQEPMDPGTLVAYSLPPVVESSKFCCTRQGPLYIFPCFQQEYFSIATTLAICWVLPRSGDLLQAIWNTSRVLLLVIQCPTGLSVNVGNKSCQDWVLPPRVSLSAQSASRNAVCDPGSWNRALPTPPIGLPYCG